MIADAIRMAVAAVGLSPHGGRELRIPNPKSWRRSNSGSAREINRRLDASGAATRRPSKTQRGLCVCVGLPQEGRSRTSARTAVSPLGPAQIGHLVSQRLCRGKTASKRLRCTGPAERCHSALVRHPRQGKDHESQPVFLDISRREAKLPSGIVFVADAVRTQAAVANDEIDFISQAMPRLTALIEKVPERKQQLTTTLDAVGSGVVAAREALASSDTLSLAAVTCVRDQAIAARHQICHAELALRLGKPGPADAALADAADLLNTLAPREGSFGH